MSKAFCSVAFAVGFLRRKRGGEENRDVISFAKTRAERREDDEYARNVTAEQGGAGITQEKENQASDVRYGDPRGADRYVVAVRISFDLDDLGIVAVGRGNAACRRVLGYARPQRLAVAQLQRSIQDDPVYAVFQKQRDHYFSYGRRNGGFRVARIVCVFETALAGAEPRIYDHACNDDLTEFHSDDSYL